MPPLEQKKKQYSELRRKALGICQSASAENRQLSEDEQKTLAEAVDQAKALKTELERDQRGVEAMRLVDELVKANSDDPYYGDGGTKTGDTLAIKAPDKPHPWSVCIKEASEAFGVKAFGMPSGSIPLVPLSTIPSSLGQLGAPLVEAIGLTPWPAEGGRALTFLRQTARVNRAALWRYGAAADGSDTTSKPVSDLTTVAVTVNAEIIAHLASPVRRDDLLDFAGLQQWVVSELQYGLGQALEANILTAAGPEPAMTGLLHQAGTTPVAFATDIPTTLMNASVALSNLGYGTGLQAALNPTNWATVATTKTTTGEYLFPSLPAAAAAPSLFGIQIIQSPNVPAGQAIVSNFRSAVSLHEREAPVVEWGTTVAAPLEKNLIAARCEGRFALAVTQPAAVAIAALA